MSGAAVQVFAVIPAAGRSERMGCPKQLLPFGETTLLESVIEAALTGGSDGLCVVTHRAIDAELALGEDPRFITAINDDPRSQMLDSILIGIAALRRRCEVRDCDAILVCPGDAAGVTAADVRASIAECRRHPDSIVVAAHEGRRGHPVIIPLSLEGEVAAGLDGGLRALMVRHPERVRIVECASPGVLEDIDTPADYARLSLDKGRS